MSVLSEVLKNPNGDQIFLSELTFGRKVSFWEEFQAPDIQQQDCIQTEPKKYFTIPYDPLFNVSGAGIKFRLRGWIYPTAENKNCGLISLTNFDGEQGAFSLGFFNGESQQLMFRINGLAGVFSDIFLQNNQWYFVEASYDPTLSSGNVKVSIDGKAHGQADYNQTIAWAPGATAQLVLGAYYSDPWIFQGMMAEWEFSIGVAATATPFTPPSTITPDVNTIAHWALNDGSGTTAADDSGNGFDLTAIGYTLAFPAWVTNGYSWIDGSIKIWKSALSLYADSVEYNGEDITQVLDIGDIGTNDKQWFWDREFIYLYIGLADPYQATIQVYIKLFFSNTKGKIFNDIHYESRIKGLPNLQLRTESNFGQIGQIGGGDLELNNHDGLFSDYQFDNWDAGKTEIKYGYDLPGQAMLFEDYETKGTFLNAGFGFSEDQARFVLNLEEIKTKINKQIPFKLFTRDEYPNLLENDKGKPKQLAYGTIYGAAAVCIDTGRNLFQVADHAIKGFLGIRVGTSNGWNEGAFETQDLNLAQFTIADWDGESSVSVDFQGRMNSDGTLMENASDQVKDILAYIGETDIDSDSFLESFNRLDMGNYLSSTNRKTVQKPSFYVSDLVDAFELINIINSYVGAFLYSDALGKFHYKVFWPDTRNGLTSFSNDDLKAGFKQNDLPENKTSKISINYAKRISEAWSQNLVVEKKEIQYLHGQKTPVLESFEFPSADLKDSDYQARRLLIFNGSPRKTYEFEIKNPIGFLLEPADQIFLQLNEDKANNIMEFNGMIEILSITYDLTNRKVGIVGGNLRGWGNRPGFWVSDNQILPAFLENLAGYGIGSIIWNKDWHRTIKDFVKLAWGYWTDDNGFADSTDPESFFGSCWV